VGLAQVPAGEPYHEANPATLRRDAASTATTGAGVGAGVGDAAPSADAPRGTAPTGGGGGLRAALVVVVVLAAVVVVVLGST
jgi:hypothetical protein